jgi:hypothetical protein
MKYIKFFLSLISIAFVSFSVGAAFVYFVFFLFGVPPFLPQMWAVLCLTWGAACAVLAWDLLCSHFGIDED